MKGFTGTGTNAGNCCTTIDPAAVTAAAGYDYVVVYAGMDSTASSGTTGTEDRDRTSLALPGQQGQLISQVTAVNPNTIARDGDDRPAGRAASFEPTTPAILWSSYNGSARASRSPTCCSARTTRAAARRRPGTERRPDPERLRLRAAPRGAERPHVHVLQRPGLLPVRVRAELHDVRASRTCTISNHTADRGRHDPGERRRHEQRLARRQRDRADVREHAERGSVAGAAAQAARGLREGLPRRRRDEDGDAADQDRRPRVLRTRPTSASRSTRARTGSRSRRRAPTATSRRRTRSTCSGALTPKPSVLTARPRIAGRDAARGISQRVHVPRGRRRSTRA